MTSGPWVTPVGRRGTSELLRLWNGSICEFRDKNWSKMEPFPPWGPTKGVCLVSRSLGLSVSKAPSLNDSHPKFKYVFQLAPPR